MFLLKAIDIYPHMFSFTYKGKNLIKTMWGGIISIFSVIIILINFMIIGKDMFLKLNPVQVKIMKYEQMTPTVRMNNNNTKIAISISDGNGGILNDDSIFTILPFIYLQKLNEEKKFIFKRFYLEIEDCKKEKGDGIFYDKCIKDMDIYLAGSWNEDYISYLSFQLLKCSNNTSTPSVHTNAKTDQDFKFLEEFEKNINKISSPYVTDEDNYKLDFHEYLKNYKVKEKKVVCKSPAEIEEFFNKGYYVNYLFQNVVPNERNYTYPLIQNVDVEYAIIGNGVYKNKEIHYENFSSETDTGWVFQDHLIDTNKFGVGIIKNDFQIAENTKLMAELDVYMTNRVNISHRSYIKLPGIFANLGGFITLTTLICKILSTPYFQKRLKLKIINEFFDVNEFSNSENVKYLNLNLN